MKILACALAITAALCAPAFAANTMMSSGGMMAGHGSTMMMQPGEVMMIMPNGETMMMPAMKGPMDPGMMKAAMPMDKCLLLMMGADHKMHMVEDMKMADGKMACAAMSAMGAMAK